MAQYTGVYSILMSAVVVSTARTLIQLNAPSTHALEIIRAWITQELSEVSTQEAIQILRVSTAGTGTAGDERALRGSQVAQATGTTNHTAEGTAGDILLREGFNILNGFLYLPVPEERIYIPPSGRIALKFPVAPASATWTAGIVWGEIG